MFVLKSIVNIYCPIFEFERVLFLISMHRICGIVFKQIVEKYFDNQFGNLMNSIIISKNFSMYFMAKSSFSTEWSVPGVELISANNSVLEFAPSSKSGGMELIFGFIFLNIGKIWTLFSVHRSTLQHRYNIDLYGSEWTHKLNNLLICRTDTIAHLLQHFSNLFYLPKPSWRISPWRLKI